MILTQNTEKPGSRGITRIVRCLQACKPPDRQHPAYARLRKFLLRELQRIHAQNEEREETEP